MDTIETEAVWTSNYGRMRIPDDIAASVVNVRRCKDGDLDYRFKAAREARLALNALVLDRYWNDVEAV